MDKPGLMTLSFDIELAWGCFYRVNSATIRQRLQGARPLLRRLLRELSDTRIQATWAFVGHLFLAECDGRHGRQGTRQSWFKGDWYAADPGTDTERDPEWYGADMVCRVRDDAVGHEIAAHGFSHCFLDDPAVSVETEQGEIAMASEAAHRLGIALRSFVYPRNRVGRTRLLKEAGFAAYRTAGSEMGTHGPRGARERLLHIVRQAAAVAPAPENPYRDGQGLVAIPGTNLYLSTAGWRRAIPVRARVRRARRGLDLAAKRGGFFHLWCHLEDFLESTEAYAAGFRRILDHAAGLRDRGELRIMTMAQVAEELS